MLRRVAVVLCLPALATPCAAAEDEPIRLPAVEVRAPYPLVPPRYRETPLPYPSGAREQHLQGTVLLAVEVRSDGRVGEVRLTQTSGARVLDQAALEAVRRWTFVPARRGPQAVDAWVEVPVVFSRETR
jgi:protein TonB